mgnify:CR=1 FL=1
MSKVIAVTNQKGGVGKTTTSVNLSAALAYMGKKVLLIDIDPQANATQGLGVDRASLEYTIYDAIAQQMPIQDISIPSGVDNLDIVPANIDLAGVEIELSQVKSGREQRLKKALGEYKNKYDYVIIDCPPALGLLNTNALTASDSVLIPVQCEYYALEGLTQLLDARTNLGVEVSQEVRKYFREKVYDVVIPRNIKLSEAPSEGLNIFDYDAHSEGAKAYAKLAKEVVKRNGRK